MGLAAGREGYWAVGGERCSVFGLRSSVFGLRFSGGLTVHEAEPQVCGKGLEAKAHRFVRVDLRRRKIEDWSFDAESQRRRGW